MSTTDSVSPELRKVEIEIDNYHKSNPLLKLPFATAAWSFMAFGEDMMLRDIVDSSTIQDRAMIVDNFVFDLKEPMNWLYRGCQGGGKAPFAYNDRWHKASQDLFKLGGKYTDFVTAYTFASNNWIELELQGSTIQPKNDLCYGVEYEAYNRLIKTESTQQALSLVNFDNLPNDAIMRVLKIKGDRFRYKLNPRMVSDMISAIIRPTQDVMFSLPGDWEFSRYSLKDFRAVFEVIAALAGIHLTARKFASDQGCVRLGYPDSIYVLTYDDLLRRTVRYSKLSDAKVQSIFDDLTYGNKGIRQPDPALQPLIKLNSNDYAIMPNLWICSAAERNLTILLNKIPSEKKVYRKLVSEKEALMRESITSDLSDKDFRFIVGRLTNLPDIDLAIVSDSEKVCLLLELKWFIDPAEAREIIEKSEEIEKGIFQIQKLKEAYTNNQLLLEKLNIDSNYKLEGIVVSENWIGNGNVQSPEVPVIRANHLIEKLKMTDSLRATMEWLKDRKYLPKEGEHFKVHSTTSTIGKWRVKWYSIQLLNRDVFFPL